MRSICVLVLLAAVAGCDSAPEPPEATNPYDPRYEGERIPSPVTEIRLEDATATSATLVWEDPSSFETRFRLMTAVDYGTPPPLGAFRFAGYLDANTTSLELDLAPSSEYRSFRITTVDDQGRNDSPPSPILRIHQPGTYTLNNLDFGSGSVHPSLNGEWAYTNGGSSVRVWDPRTGGAAGLHSDVDAYVGTLASGDDVLFAASATLRSTPGVARVMVVDGADVRRTMDLQNVPAFTSGDATERRVRASADGSRLLAIDGSALSAWSLESGVRVSTVSGGGSGTLRSVTADGRLALVSTNDGLTLVDVEAGQIRWQTLRYETGLISPDGSLILGGRFADRGVEAVDLQSGAPISVLSAPDGRPMEPITFDVTGDLVAVGVRKVERHYIDVFRVSDLSLVRETRVLSPSDRVTAGAGYSVRILGGGDRIGGYNFRTTSNGSIEVKDYVSAWQVAP